MTFVCGRKWLFLQALQLLNNALQADSNGIENPYELQKKSSLCGLFYHKGLCIKTEPNF